MHLLHQYHPPDQRYYHVSPIYIYYPQPSQGGAKGSGKCGKEWELVTSHLSPPILSGGQYYSQYSNEQCMCSAVPHILSGDNQGSTPSAAAMKRSAQPPILILSAGNDNEELNRMTQYPAQCTVAMAMHAACSSAPQPPFSFSFSVVQWGLCWATLGSPALLPIPILSGNMALGPRDRSLPMDPLSPREYCGVSTTHYYPH